MQPISRKSMKHMVEAVRSAGSILEQLSSIAVPSIIAGGAEDTALPMSASRDIHEQIGNSILVEIPQCGHSSSIEQPEKVTELLGQLLLKLNHS
jgi:3-oxoadipate enol-lactonase